MDKNIFKKTIALAYLFIFAIGLFIPLSSIFAQTPTGIIVTTGDANVVSPEEATVNGSWSFSSAYSGNQNTTTWVEYGTTATPTGWSSSPPV